MCNHTWYVARTKYSFHTDAAKSTRLTGRVWSSLSIFFTEGRITAYPAANTNISRKDEITTDAARNIAAAAAYHTYFATELFSSDRKQISIVNDIARQIVGRYDKRALKESAAPMASLPINDVIKTSGRTRIFREITAI